MSEAAGLAEALGLELVEARIEPLRMIEPSHYFGGGKVASLASEIAERGAGLVLVDDSLSPVQQRNLERDLKCKVMDRTGLILEIFGLRARTREGKLQVELARLDYERSRLVRTWTHLERQRGGLGKTGGPGESQLELDRRQIGAQITRLKRELDEVRRTRALHRSARKRKSWPTIACVGYTNAGKSTLFNALTRSDVFARNMPFATLDPTTRGFDLPDSGKALLIDTVGFIADLPTELVAAFRATLEEVMEADILLHVRDVAHADSLRQRADVLDVLARLADAHERAPPPMIEVWNKIDLLAEDEQAAWRAKSSLSAQAGHDRQGSGVAVSALTGEGFEDLLAAIRMTLAEDFVERWFRLGPEAGAARAFLFSQAAVMEENTGEDGQSALRVRMDRETAGRFDKKFGGQSE